MKRAEVIFAIRVIIRSGIETNETFIAATGFTLDAMPDPIPDIVNRWSKARWRVARYKPRLLAAKRELEKDNGTT